MRWKAFRWHDFTLALLSILFPIWTYAVAWANEQQQNRILVSRASNLALLPASFFENAFLRLKYPIPIIIAASIIFINIRKVLKESIAKKTMHNFLNFLHEKFFPHGFSGLDKEFRVSLFTPTRWLKWRFLPYPCLNKYLVLYTRSGDIFPKSKVSWDATTSENEARFDGIAGYAWATGNFVNKPNLPDFDGGGEAEQTLYLEQTYLSTEKAAKLNIRSRSYQALVIKNRSDEKVGLLMMESEKPDGLESLSVEQWLEISRTIQSLFLS